MSCSWIVQFLSQKQAGQCCAAQLGSEVLGAEPDKGPVAHERVGWWGCIVVHLCCTDSQLPGELTACASFLKGKEAGCCRVPAWRHCCDCSSLKNLPQWREGKVFNLVFLPCVWTQASSVSQQGGKGQKRFPVWLADQGGCRQFSVLLVLPLTLPPHLLLLTASYSLWNIFLAFNTYSTNGCWTPEPDLLPFACRLAKLSCSRLLPSQSPLREPLHTLLSSQC